MYALKTLRKPIFFIVLMLIAQPAQAHPHIFVKYDVEIGQKDKSTLVMHFTFRMHNIVTPNPLFRDQQQVTGNLLADLGQHPFYLYPDINGYPLGQKNVDLIRAGGTDDEPIYTFDWNVPTDAESFGFELYDPEYYDSISLNGGDALEVEVNSLTCATSYHEVSKTMWGVNRATHVECGDRKKPPPHVFIPKHNQYETPDIDTAPYSKKMLLP